VLGPLLISRVIDVTGSYTLAFYIIAAIMVGSAVVAFIVSRCGGPNHRLPGRKGRGPGYRLTGRCKHMYIVIIRDEAVGHRPTRSRRRRGTGGL
jgi:hypothetical protein